MSKLTLLEIVQDVLNDLDSDVVSGINDTVESGQVAQMAKTVYFDLITERDWPHLRQMFTLDDPSDLTMTTVVKIPENVKRISVIKYNAKLQAGDDDLWRELKWMEPSDFLEHVHKFKSSASTTESYTLKTSINGSETSTNIPVMVENDRAPEWYTSFDDEYIVMDAYNSSLGTRVLVSKLQCYGEREPVFTLTDSFVPDLPAKAFPYYLSELKSKCFVVLKQSANAKEEQRAKKQRFRMAREKWVVNGGIKFPNYGRR